jgi:hypothetical protein
MACNQPSPTARERGIMLGFPPPADRQMPGGGTAAFPKSLVGALVGIQIGLGGIDPERRGLQLAAADAVGRALE